MPMMAGRETTRSAPPACTMPASLDGVLLAADAVEVLAEMEVEALLVEDDEVAELEARAAEHVAETATWTSVNGVSSSSNSMSR